MVVGSRVAARGAGAASATSLLLLVLPLGLSAQGGPPLLTDDPFTPRAWHWEINTGSTMAPGPAVGATEVPVLDLSYGMGPKIELNAAVPYRWVSADGTDHSGWGNATTGVKVRFADSFHGWAFSAFPQVQIPRSRKGAARIYGDSVWAFLVPLEAAHSHGRLEVAAETGYWLGPREVRQATYGLVVGWIVTSKLEALSECNGHGDRVLAPLELVCGLGVRQDLSDHVGLMGAFEPVVAGSDPERPRYHVFLGLESHIRGGGFWKGARRRLIGK